MAPRPNVGNAAPSTCYSLSAGAAAPQLIVGVGTCLLCSERDRDRRASSLELLALITIAWRGVAVVPVSNKITGVE